MCWDTYYVLGPQLNAELDLQVLCYLIGGGERNLFSIGLCHLSLSFQKFFFNFMRKCLFEEEESLKAPWACLLLSRLREINK